MEVLVLVMAVGVLAGVAAAMAWQERRRPAEPRRAVVYGVEDSISYVWDRLPDDVRSELTRRDVRRILEWELHYLQQPKLRDRPALVGGVEAAEHIQDMAHRHGHSYEPRPIFAVLELQAAYLAELGAIGDAVEEP